MKLRYYVMDHHGTEMLQEYPSLVSAFDACSETQSVKVMHVVGGTDVGERLKGTGPHEYTVAHLYPSLVQAMRLDIHQEKLP